MKFRNAAKRYGAPIVAGAGSMAAAGPSFAVGTSYLPADLAAGFTQATADWGTMTGYIWPLVILVTFTLLGVAWFKRGARQAK